MPNWVTSRIIFRGPSAVVREFRNACFVTVEITGRDELQLEPRLLIPMPKEVEGTEDGSNSRIGIPAACLLEMIEAGTRDPLKLKPMPMDIGRIESELESWTKLAATWDPAHPYSHLKTRNAIEAELRKPGYGALAVPITVGKKSLEAWRVSGHLSWYDWSIASWGTKWGGWSVREERLDTVQGMPPHVDTELEVVFDTAWSVPKPVLRKIAERWPTMSFEGTAIDEGMGFAAEIAYEGLGPQDESSDDVTIDTVDATDAHFKAVFKQNRCSECGSGYPLESKGPFCLGATCEYNESAGSEAETAPQAVVPTIGPHFGVDETCGVADTVLDQIPYKGAAGRSWELIPPHMRFGLWRFFNEGVIPGNFLTAVIENDLRETFARADDKNRLIVDDYLKFLWNWGPATAFGSRERVRAWAKSGGLEGQASATREVA
jgi:Ferredoxin-like domain in Api92-like protein